VRVAERGGYAAVKSAVAPGTSLTLDATIGINAALPRCRVNFAVIRNDGLTMFDGSPMVDGEPPIDLDSGSTLSVRVHFRANVLRGTYRVLLQLVDTHKLWDPITVSGLASFVVHETTRVAGCAELDPAYELRVGAGESADEPARVLRVV
jgi:hypothetical protein